MMIEILPFFSRLFVDEEAEQLDRRFFRMQAPKGQWIPFSFVEFLKDSCRMTGTFYEGAAEGVAEVVLTVCAIMNSVVGVSKEELYQVLAQSGGRLQNGDLGISYLIDRGFFRENQIVDEIVLFPTEKAFRRLIWHREQFHKDGVAK